MTTLTQRDPATPKDAMANAGGRVGAGALTIQDVVPSHLLDGGEVVHFAIKPSPWFVLLVSVRWVLTGIALAVVASVEIVPIPTTYRWYLWQLGFLLAGARLCWGLLEWVSRLYVLTNRRVMRLRGILNVELFECALDRIQNTYLTLSLPERFLRVGTVTFQTAAGGEGGSGTGRWLMVARPLEVHEKLRQAISRAQNRGNNGL